MMAAEIRLCPADRAVLEGWARAPRTEQRRALRARVVLLAADGMATGAIAERLGVRPSTVSKWRGRCARLGLEGLGDAPRGGRPARYDAASEARILAKLDEAPPPGFARWNGRLLAAALGDVSRHQVWRVLRAHRISLARRRSWCVSTDPEFAAKAADIVGLYLNPPEHAVVLCVDEKPHIQALERLLAPLQAARHHHPVRRPRARHRPGPHGPLQAPQARRVPRLHERGGRRPSCKRDPRGPRQPQHPQAQA
jgi:transposase